MKIHNVVQGSEEWIRLRLGRVTASEMDALFTPLMKPKEGEGPKTYLATKVAEAWYGAPLPSVGSFAMEQGHFIEEHARPWFELTYEKEVTQVGFIEHDDGRCGCSPDGLIGDDEGLEIKSPMPHTHTKYCLAGKVPPEYVAQVQGSLYITGRKRWHFVSYCRRFPSLVLTVERDESIMAIIGHTLAKFYEQFDEAMAKMRALNGTLA